MTNNDKTYRTPSVTTVGVNSCIGSLKQTLTPYSEQDNKPGLARQTIDGLKQFFAGTEHEPSIPMWQALKDVARVLEEMANGKAEPVFHLSSLDPGVGKTRTIIQFTKALLASPDHADVGVLICVSRLDEIHKLTEEMELSEDAFAVLTRDDNTNTLSSTPSDKAQVLFTTQQMVESRCDHKSFSDVGVFHFSGCPRQVRIWDEAILPGQTLTISRDQIGHLFSVLRRPHCKLAEAIEDIFNKLKDLDDHATYDLPDLYEEYGVSLNEVLGLFADSPQEHQQIASTLWQLSGKRVTVRNDGVLGNTVLDYRDTLPDDLAPLLVMDASGRVRTTYKHWEERRGNLVMLRKATKRYDSLTIHVWNTGGGKSSFSRNTETLVDGIVSTINSKPDKEWLVVHHKETSKVDIPSQVLDLITGNKERVHFVHWGNHHGTNAYSHVENVILAGTLFYRPSHYEALGRLGAGLKPYQRLNRQDAWDVTVGEHSHLILQALCRGAVRRCVKDVCAPCDAYIIASPKTGIKEALPDIFPGCRIEAWEPVERILTGKIGDTFWYVSERLKEDPEAIVPFKEVMQAVGMSDSKNFRRSVRKHPDLMDALADLGIVECVRGMGAAGFVYAVRLYGFGVELTEAA